MAVLYYFSVTHGGVPALLGLSLVLAVYLAVIEVRPLDSSFRLKVWWVSLVILTHFIGYLTLRAWVFLRRRMDGATG
jgi:hypothetical protein